MLNEFEIPFLSLIISNRQVFSQLVITSNKTIRIIIRLRVTKQMSLLLWARVEEILC